jgi:oligosaccharide repeat unit polymerase
MFLAAMASVALLRPAMAHEPLPLLLPFLATVLSSTCLFLFGKNREALASYMRVGFHIGIFAYFLSYAIILPEEIGVAVSERTHVLVGLTLLITIVGFELGYWMKGMPDAPDPKTTVVVALNRTRTRRLFTCIVFGVTIWLLSVWLLASASGVPIEALLFKMRRALDLEQDNDVTFYRYLYEVFRAGLFLAASSAYLLLTNIARRSLPVTVLCWLVILLCAVVGFLSGSRAMFLYSIIPVTLACWVMWEQMFGTTLRWLLVMVGAFSLVVVWGTMSAIRDVGFLEYDADLLHVLLEDPGTHVAGAFNLYYGIAMIVEAFPDIFPYEYGKSLVALLLGWLPRSLWPEKPYTFGLYANLIQGETLESRSASLAVGLAGEGYANFGLFGAFGWGAIMGLACVYADTYIARLAGSQAFKFLPALLSGVWSAMIVRGGVPEMFYMGVFILLSQILLAKYVFEHRTDPQGTSEGSEQLGAPLWPIR